MIKLGKVSEQTKGVKSSFPSESSSEPQLPI